MSERTLARRVYRRAVLVPLWRVRREIRAWRNAALPRVIETSIPKSGTHLVKGALDSLGYRHLAHQPVNPDVLLQFNEARIRPALNALKHGEFVTEHLRWTKALEDLLRDLQFRVLFVYRDPRAVCLSFIQYHLKNNFRFGDFMRLLPDNRARIMAVLNGIADHESSTGCGRAPLGEIYDAFYPWKNSPSVWAASFEELVGAGGGGSDARQIEAVRRLITHLGLEATDERIRIAASRVFDPKAATFRSGRAGGWRNELSSDEIHLLNSRLERQILEWGYSIDG